MLHLPYPLFIVLCIFVCLGSCDFDDLCDVTNDCEGKEAGTLIQDPLDCHNFYECILNVQGEVVVSNAYITCPAGEYFDEENQRCTTETFQCSNKCSKHLCPKTCDGLPDGTRIPYPNNCNEFEVCFNDEENRVFGSCSDEFPYFNGTGKEEGTLIQDPLDCHNFYECVLDVQDEVVVSDVYITCPAGEYFDEENQQCTTETFQCSNRCSNLLCPKTCDGLPESTRIAYPNDCNQYEVCYDDEENRTFGSCSEDFPYFNGTDCTTDIYSCCDICTPYCQVAFTQVEDPYDCYSFYPLPRR
ncbi:hypothetical protein Avbf_15987 [Armadillidium vulgare]|nr:hypothetical protein Avbf_15987 [Armadillidium vulgare]